MDDHNIRRFNRATRVQTFGKENAGDFLPGSKATLLFAQLDPVIEKLRAAAVGQLRSPVGKAALIHELSIDFKNIARTARAIQIDERGFPAADYRHPGTSVETPVTTHADALLARLENAPTDTAAQTTAKFALRAKFIDYEIAADFVEDLRADRDALANCNEGKISDNLEGVESTSAIDTLLTTAQSLITRIDTAVRNKYSRNPDKLAAWKSASHTERAPKKKPTPPTP